MFNPPSPLTLDSQYLYLEIPISSQIQIPEQPYSTPGTSQRAWVNQLCLQAFLPWFREEIAANAKVYPNVAALPSFWELVNGTPLTFNNYHLILIPTLAIDGEELRVPQEWVDIPEWVADYYVAVEVNPDDGCIKIFGYTTHHQLKTKGVYNVGDRTYSLDSEDLVADINVLWVAQQTKIREVLRTTITPLDSISPTQAENLIARLGNPDLKFPRLAIPFQLWGALLANPSDRKQLSQQRQGISSPWSVPQWLQTGVATLAQQWGWEKREFVTVPVGTRSIEAVSGLSRQLIIAGNTYELRIFPKQTPEYLIWRFELRNTNPNTQIPVGFKLRLLTADLQEFENNQDVATTAVDMLYLEVILEPGEGLIWQTEPTPEDWEQEILWF